MGRDHFPNIPIGAGMGFARGVMLLDDCEGTFSWYPYGTGGDDVHTYATAAAFTGTYGIQLKTRTTNAAADDVTAIQKFFGHPESGLLVARAKIATPSQAAIKSINFLLIHANGIRAYTAQLKFTPATPKIEYTDAAGNLVAIPTLARGQGDYQFITWELVIDCRTHQYLSAMVNGARADLTGINVWNTGAITEHYAGLALAVIAIGAAPAEIYVDNIYVGEYLES